MTSVSSLGGGRVIEIAENKLRELLWPLVKAIEVDETWYVTYYNDVADAIARGAMKSGREHYVTDGYFEDRLPRPVKVDEAWYLETYRDVREAISRGAVMDAQHHFEVDGYREGRLPYASWSL